MNTTTTNLMTDFNITNQDKVYKGIQKVSFGTSGYSKTIATTGGDSFWLLSSDELYSLWVKDTRYESGFLRDSSTASFGKAVWYFYYDGGLLTDDKTSPYYSDRILPAFQIGL